MKRPSLGLAYVAVTSTLLVAVSASAYCLQSAASLQQEETGRVMMTLSCLLFVSSQIAFFISAMRKNDDESNRTGSSRFLVLVLAGMMLLAIAWTVFLLSNMPS